MRARSAAKAVMSPNQGAFELGPPVPFPGAQTPAARLVNAAAALLEALEHNQPLEARFLQQVMTDAFGASDAEGAWLWKDAYEACEVAQLQYLRRHLPALRRRAKSPADLLDAVTALAALTPTHTRRSEESQRFQQFSTPLPLALIASLAADIRSADHVLEPSAGTGQLAIFAEDAGARLHLNEIAGARADLLTLLFTPNPVTRHNAEHIHDLLAEDVRPTVILMNPPFSAALHVKGRARGADFRHLRSALQRLTPGGRLVAITGASFSPANPEYRGAFATLADTGRLVFSAPIAGAVYQRQGTTVETRLSVFDRVPGDADPRKVCCPTAGTAQELLRLVTAYVPPRHRRRRPPRSPPLPTA
jgi:predicted RNA methylase